MFRAMTFPGVRIMIRIIQYPFLFGLAALTVAVAQT